jgi:hypothetical protein
MFMLRDKEIAIPETVSKNATLDSIKDLLNELFGMSFLELDPDAGVFRPSYRDFHGIPVPTAEHCRQR